MKKSLLFALLSVPGAVLAHGINGHVHVTGWAIERLPPGPLADFFADPEVREAAQIGASFPDSGYAINDGYGELAHWEPYVRVHLAWLQERYPPPLVDREAKKQLAFLMGLAAHGLQDELFDSVFLYHIEHHDGAGQERSDPGTDAFLFTDGWLQYKPALHVPFDDLPEIFQRAHGHQVAPGTIRAGMNRVKLLVIDGFSAIAPILDAEHRPHLPWTAQHYVDPAIPGSLAAEIPATGAYLQALWDRFHGELGLEAVHTWPHAPRRLLGTEDVDAWITLVFGSGVRLGSLTGDTVQLTDADGMRVPVQVLGTRWSGNPESSSRLVRLQPEVPLEPDATYTVTLLPGIAGLDDRTLQEPWTFSFLTACTEAQGCAPEPEGELPPRPPPPEADAGVADAGPEADGPDAGPEADAGSPDAAADLATAPDAAAVDARVGGDASTEAPATGGSSGGCSIGARVEARGGLLALGLILAQRLRARRKPTGRKRESGAPA